MNNFHSKTIKETASFFEADIKEGLSEDQVKKRREKYGKNIIPEAEPPSRFKIFISQFKSPLVFVLAIAGIVVLVMGKYTDAIVIWAAVFLNTAIGYFQENKATRALDELKKVLKVTAKVIRSGNEKKISEEEIVPGDLIVLTAGDKVPADARIVKSWNLKAGEAALTGEWIPSRKEVKPLDKKTPLADRENMVYMGTTIESGEGLAVVVKTGKDTEIGRVAVMVQDIKERETPYQVKIKRFSWILASVISLIALFIFIEGLLTGGKFVEMFTLSIAVAVAAIPEGLPVAFTAILAVGMQRILKEKGLVRHLTSAETLGSSSVIATDKTLTLTEGKMEVQEVYAYKSNKKEVLTASALANDAFVENPDEPFEHWIIQGNPTEKALLKASIESGISRKKILEKEPLIHKIPFDSVKKYTASFHKIKKGTKIYISGAPEAILNLSGNVSKKEKEEVLDKLNELTNKGLRVVASASRTVARFKKDGPESSIKNLDFLGFIAMRDPIRKGVKEAIELARSAGIHVLMVTGDHPRTALAVARELNMTINSEKVIEGREIDEMSDKELQESLSKVNVYARVEPKHKMRIVNAWQVKEEVIAMTGDGINDAPALRKADIGIALGSGTDVAKEVSDIILLGDKFSIIPKAIRQGRILIDNIRKSITYMLSSAFSELILVSTAIVVGLPLPVTAVQILWVNLVEDALPGVAFTFEKGEKGVMKRKPEPKNAPLLTKEMKGIIFIIGIITDIILLGIFLYLLNNTNYSIEHIRSFIFVALIIDSLFYVFSCRNLNLNIWQYNPFSNKFINWTVIVGILLMLAVIYFPFLQNIFETVPLDFIDWLLLSGVGFINLFLIELMKYLFVSKKISN